MTRICSDTMSSFCQVLCMLPVTFGYDVRFLTQYFGGNKWHENVFTIAWGSRFMRHVRHQVTCLPKCLTCTCVQQQGFCQCNITMTWACIYMMLKEAIIHAAWRSNIRSSWLNYSFWGVWVGFWGQDFLHVHMYNDQPACLRDKDNTDKKQHRSCCRPNKKGNEQNCW